MKKTLLALTAALSFNAAANPYLDFDITYLYENDFIGNEDFSQTTLSGRYGFNFNENSDTFQNKVEAFFGFGLTDDDILNTNVELTHYWGLAYRPTYKINDDWEVFARVSHGRFYVEVDSISASDTETGYGLGASYKGFNLSVEKFDDIKFVNFGYSFKY